MVPSETITLTLKLPGSGGLDAAPARLLKLGLLPSARLDTARFEGG
jgi:hypothetical protein